MGLVLRHGRRMFWGLGAHDIIEHFEVGRRGQGGGLEHEFHVVGHMPGIEQGIELGVSIDGGTVVRSQVRWQSHIGTCELERAERQPIVDQTCARRKLVTIPSLE